MLIEISLVTIAVASVILIILLGFTSYQSRKAVQLIQTDVHQVSQEAKRILNKINEFMDTDLQTASQETNDLLSNLNTLSSDVKDKVHAFDFLFRPLQFLNSKLGATPSSDQASTDQVSSEHCETVPQILKWIASSVFLIKTTKEFVKNEK